MSISSAIFHPRQQRSPQAMRLRATYANLALWTMQSWLFLFYVAAGYDKLTEPRDILIILLGWPEAASEDLLHFIGVLETMLALLLLAPILSSRLRALMVVGAAAIVALAAIMLSIHLQRQEFGLAFINLVLASLACALLRGRTDSSLRQGA